MPPKNLKSSASTPIILAQNKPSASKAVCPICPEQTSSCRLALTARGVGLTTAMTMLKSGWVIVGSAPSSDGTTRTKGAGCLIVLDASGKVKSVIANEGVNMH
ncbi:MAG TPA: hypothetical protein VMI06_14620, partial [Terriglobia bacterium]|nr:hypothetical protein [Terriglobia bacterium]